LFVCFLLPCFHQPSPSFFDVFFDRMHTLDLYGLFCDLILTRPPITHSQSPSLSSLLLMRHRRVFTLCIYTNNFISCRSTFVHTYTHSQLVQSNPLPRSFNSRIFFLSPIVSTLNRTPLSSRGENAMDEVDAISYATVFCKQEA